LLVVEKALKGFFDDVHRSFGLIRKGIHRFGFIE
jgi:hypothetical protein